MSGDTNGELEKRGLRNLDALWQREYDDAKRSWPKAGAECWEWHANEAVQAALDGYASVA